MFLIPQKREGKIALGAIVVAHLAFVPPFLDIANDPELVFGFPPLYLWTLFWGSVVIVSLLYAARTGAWGLTEDQVPPDIRGEMEGVGITDTERDERTAPEADA